MTSTTPRTDTLRDQIDAGEADQGCAIIFAGTVEGELNDALYMLRETRAELTDLLTRVNNALNKLEG